MNDTENRFENISIVLVRPTGLRNIGSTARAMKNTGFSDLAIVEPPDFRCRETFDMAPNSHDILEKARTFDTLEEALYDRHIVFGVTARPRFKRKRLEPAEAAATWQKSSTAGCSRAALVFGPEDHGLSTKHLSLCRHIIGIPTHPDHHSLNLSQAVLLTCHAFFLGGIVKTDEERRELSTTEEKKRIETAVLSILTEAGYLTPEREIPLRQTVRRLVTNSEIETRDGRNVLAAVRHIRYVLKNK